MKPKTGKTQLLALTSTKVLALTLNRHNFQQTEFLFPSYIHRYFTSYHSDDIFASCIIYSQNSKMKLYEKTNYPEVYITSYWGLCNFMVEDICGRDDVIDNRNAFVEKFDITYPCHPDSNKLNEILGKKCFDHCELFKGRNGNIILISSYYKAKSPEGMKETMSVMGFFLGGYMYHPLADTYVQEFDNEKEFENFLILYGKEGKEAIGSTSHGQANTLVDELIAYSVANDLPYTAELTRLLIPTLRRERCFKIKFPN